MVILKSCQAASPQLSLSPFHPRPAVVMNGGFLVFKLMLTLPREPSVLLQEGTWGEGFKSLPGRSRDLCNEIMDS